MFDLFVIVRALEEGKIKNPQERLHGYITKSLSRFVDVKKLHGEERKIEFSLSPIYSYDNLRIVTSFKKGFEYFFRIASLNKEIFSRLSRYLSLFPIFRLADMQFEIKEYLSETNFEILSVHEDILYFVSPTTFRISKTENYPLPDPNKIFKSLSLRSKKKYPESALIKKFSIQSKPLFFSHHTLIGFIGYVVFSSTIENLHLAHFTGIGYSISRGYGIKACLIC